MSIYSKYIEICAVVSGRFSPKQFFVQTNKYKSKSYVSSFSQNDVWVAEILAKDAKPITNLNDAFISYIQQSLCN